MGPIHELAAELRHLLINKCQELICPPQEQPEVRRRFYNVKNAHLAALRRPYLLV